MEHYTPKHPLPAEIESMATDETVCQFCGVSYLIHREIKALEDKLAEAEKQLAKLRGCQEREAKLQNQIKVSEAEKGMVEEQLKDRDAIVAMLQREVDRTQPEMRTLRESCESLNAKLNLSEKLSEKHQRDNEQLRQVITQLLTSVRQQKDTIGSLRNEVTNHNSDMENTITAMTEKLGGALKLQAKKMEDGEDREAQLQQQVNQLKDSLQRNIQQLDEAQRDITSNSQLSAQISDALSARDKAMDSNRALKNDLIAYEGQCKQLNGDLELSRKEIDKRIAECDSVSEQFRLSQQTYESRLHTLDRELSETKSDCQRIRGQLEKLVRENESAKHSQIEKEKAATRSKSETEDIRSKLERVLGDLEALKNEREQMITAHQNRIEDLRESFKRKMSEADKWPEKMEKSLQRERSKHQSELSALEAGMKENFVMEMEIEKQKHQQMLDKVTSELKSEVTKLRGQIRSTVSNQAEIEALKQQLRTHKADAQGTEARLRSEIENLKNIISNLEGRLGKLDTGDQELVLRLKSQLSDKERNLEDCEDKIKTQDDEIVKLKEQLQLLQDIVKRECEERMELIDALGEAREQLLILKKPAGGYSSRNGSPKLPAALPLSTTSHSQQQSSRITTPPPISGRNAVQSDTPGRHAGQSDTPGRHAGQSDTPGRKNSQSHSTSRRSSNSEELMLFKRTNQNSARKHTDTASVTSDNSNTQSSVKNMNYPGTDNSKPKPMQALRAMDSTQKKRIAAILSRNNK